MAAPHVAGAAALLKSVHPDWSVSQLVSAIETTATAEQAIDFTGDPASPNVRGSGRPQLGMAANTGLYLDVKGVDFLIANPAGGGQPRDLNLSGLADASCQSTCSFTRTVTDQQGGGNWTATAIDFPGGVTVNVNPSSFSLGNGQSRSLTVAVDHSQSGKLEEWISGSIRLRSSGSPDQFLTVNVFADGGELPSTWSISSDRDGGWQEFVVDGLVALPDATFSSGGLALPSTTTEVLLEDPTDDEPYDFGEGVFTV